MTFLDGSQIWVDGRGVGYGAAGTVASITMHRPGDAFGNIVDLGPDVMGESGSVSWSPNGQFAAFSFVPGRINPGDPYVSGVGVVRYRP